MTQNKTKMKKKRKLSLYDQTMEELATNIEFTSISSYSWLLFASVSLTLYPFIIFFLHMIVPLDPPQMGPTFTYAFKVFLMAFANTCVPTAWAQTVTLREPGLNPISLPIQLAGQVVGSMLATGLVLLLCLAAFPLPFSFFIQLIAQIIMYEPGILPTMIKRSNPDMDETETKRVLKHVQAPPMLAMGFMSLQAYVVLAMLVSGSDNPVSQWIGWILVIAMPFVPELLFLFFRPKLFAITNQKRHEIVLRMVLSMGYTYIKFVFLTDPDFVTATYFFLSEIVQAVWMTCEVLGYTNIVNEKCCGWRRRQKQVMPQTAVGASYVVEEDKVQKQEDKENEKKIDKENKENTEKENENEKEKANKSMDSTINLVTLHAVEGLEMTILPVRMLQVLVTFYVSPNMKYMAGMGVQAFGLNQLLTEKKVFDFVMISLAMWVGDLIIAVAMNVFLKRKLPGAPSFLHTWNSILRQYCWVILAVGGAVMGSISVSLLILHDGMDYSGTFYSCKEMGNVTNETSVEELVCPRML